MKIFQLNNYVNRKKYKLLELLYMYQQFLFWRGVAHVSLSYVYVYD